MKIPKKSGIERYNDGYSNGIKEGVRRSRTIDLKEFKDHELIEEVINRGIAVAMIHTNQVEVKEDV